MSRLEKEDIDIILESLENHLEYDKEISKIKNYTVPVFRAERRKNSGYTGYFFGILKAILFSFFPFFLPLLSKYLVRLSYFEDIKQNTINFYSSNKSISILNSKNNTKNYISLVTSGERAKFKFNQIVFLYKLNWNFLIKYRKCKWFYEAIFWLPELVVYFSYLKASNATSIKITNHYDRWAHITSCFCNIDNRSLILYQHGIVNDNFIPCRKLPLISTLYTYSEEQYGIFKNNISSNIKNCIIAPPKIKLFEVEEKNVQTVFLVGHGDRKVIESLYWLSKELSVIGYIVFAKPHPAYIDIFEKYDWQVNNTKIITSEKGFPDVDYVIHCASTLELEYRINSSKAIIYDLSLMSKLEILEAIR